MNDFGMTPGVENKSLSTCKSYIFDNIMIEFW